MSTVLRPRGLKGEIKCNWFAPVPPVITIDGRQFKVLKSGDYDNYTYLYLDGVTTVEMADRLRGKSIFIERADFALQHDELLTSDLVGYTVLDKHGRRLGTVTDVSNFGAGHICDCGTFSFPYEDEFVRETDMTERTITLHKPISQY